MVKFPLILRLALTPRGRLKTTNKTKQKLAIIKINDGNLVRCISFKYLRNFLIQRKDTIYNIQRTFEFINRPK